MAEEKAEIQQQLDRLKKEIHLLSVQLKELGEQKELKYREKEGLNQALNNYIKEAKELRDKKKEIDTKIKELKEKRKVFNKTSSELLSKFREIRATTIPAKKRISPTNIQKQIEKIEFAIQTEALSFEREKKYMQQLHELKAELQQLKTEDEKFKEVRDFREQIKEKKSEADTVHENIQKLAIDGSDIFKKLTLQSENIAKAKASREAINQVLQEIKSQIYDVDNRLSDLLEQWSALTAMPIFSETNIIPDLQKRAEQAMEKLKSKGKLTKEDILAMQGQNLKRK
jgi:uncharacterized coiled-coil DUF342 family protein